MTHLVALLQSVTLADPLADHLRESSVPVWVWPTVITLAAAVVGFIVKTILSLTTHSVFTREESDERYVRRIDQERVCSGHMKECERVHARIETMIDEHEHQDAHRGSGQKIAVLEANVAAFTKGFTERLDRMEKKIDMLVDRSTGRPEDDNG